MFFLGENEYVKWLVSGYSCSIVLLLQILEEKLLCKKLQEIRCVWPVFAWLYESISFPLVARETLFNQMIMIQPVSFSIPQQTNSKEKFEPKYKMKGRSSSKKHHLRKKGHEQQEKKVCTTLTTWFCWNLDYSSFFSLCSIVNMKTHIN